MSKHRFGIYDGSAAFAPFPFAGADPYTARLHGPVVHRLPDADASPPRVPPIWHGVVPPPLYFTRLGASVTDVTVTPAKWHEEHCFCQPVDVAGTPHRRCCMCPQQRVEEQSRKGTAP